MTQTEALKLALEALEDIKGDCSGCEFEWSNDYPLQAKAHTAIKEALANHIEDNLTMVAQPEQEPVAWKLVPIKPTREMLEAMDECSTEGYDERLYAGHAASVYMAAVDAAPASPQQCYCGDITRLGVVHRADSFCDEKPEQEPVAVKHMMEWVDYLKRKSDYGQHLQIPSEMSAGACWDLARELEQFITTPPQRKPLDMTEIVRLTYGIDEDKPATMAELFRFARAIEAAHGIKGEA